MSRAGRISAGIRALPLHDLTAAERAQLKELETAEIEAQREEIKWQISTESGRLMSGPEEQAAKDAKAELARIKAAQLAVWMNAQAREVKHN